MLANTGVGNVLALLLSGVFFIIAGFCIVVLVKKWQRRH
jgi:LPXTG-motif cell wall-anchored protein